MRAEKAFVKAPTLVWSRGQASSEEIFFLFAQTAHSPQLCQRPCDFFFHAATVPFKSWAVEAEKFPGEYTLSPSLNLGLSSPGVNPCPSLISKNLFPLIRFLPATRVEFPHDAKNNSICPDPQPSPVRLSKSQITNRKSSD